MAAVASPSESRVHGAVAWRGSGANRLRSASLLLGLLALWEIGIWLIKQPVIVVPSPSLILGTLVQNAGVLWRDVQPTFFEASIGFVLGSGVGLLLALAFARWPAVEEPIYDLAVMLHSIPLIAIVPLLVIWLGSGYGPKIVVAALATFFPVLINATRGFKAIDQQVWELMHVLHANWWQTFRKVRFPASLPYLFAAFKISAPAAVLGATIAEWVGSQSSLGYRILAAMYEFDARMLWATMLVSALLAGASFAVFALLERVVTGRWAEPARLGGEEE